MSEWFDIQFHNNLIPPQSCNKICGIQVTSHKWHAYFGESDNPGTKRDGGCRFPIILHWFPSSAFTDRTAVSEYLHLFCQIKFHPEGQWLSFLVRFLGKIREHLMWHQLWWSRPTPVWLIPGLPTRYKPHSCTVYCILMVKAWEYLLKKSPLGHMGIIEFLFKLKIQNEESVYHLQIIHIHIAPATSFFAKLIEMSALYNVQMS